VKTIFNRLAIAFLFVVVAFGGCIYYFAPRPPKETKMIQNFNEHRADFEKLRDMLQVDTNLTRVASWGVETRKPFFLGNPLEEISLLTVTTSILPCSSKRADWVRHTAKANKPTQTFLFGHAVGLEIQNTLAFVGLKKNQRTKLLL
jgi:hypothetical protein